jgi:hypothetical protein
MWKTFVPVVTGLSLLLAVPAPAKEPFVRAVVLKGILRHEQGAKTSYPEIPFEYWKVIADGKTYYLDLRGKELLELAEKLVNRPVVVTGIPDPASPTLRVTSLKADDFVKETINVEIRGRLGSWREPRIIDPWYDRWPDPGFGPHLRPCPEVGKLGPIVSWWIYLGEKYYRVDFGARKELLDLAKQLDGQSVIVTGTRVGEVIHVVSMKADEGAYQETVTVEVQGILERDFVELLDVWFKIEPPKSGGKVPLPVGWIITADGKTYTLAFGNRHELEKLAAKLVNKTVVVTGTLKDGVLTVTGLQPADANDLPVEKSAP